MSFIKDSNKSVADYLKEAGDVKVTEFKRVALEQFFLFY